VTPPPALDATLSTALALALVGLVPMAFAALTAFVKVSTVLAIVRAGIGAEGVPSNVVVLALSIVLSMVVMAPVASEVRDRVAPVLAEERLPANVVPRLLDAARDPVVRFLGRHASKAERERFLRLARAARPPAEGQQVHEGDLLVVAPAFLVTELVEAFTLGFALLLPFLVVDLVVANVLAALGVQAIGIAGVSLPFKLLLFLAADGWGVLAETLVSGYR
jgi:type III secretion protein R